MADAIEPGEGAHSVRAARDASLNVAPDPGDTRAGTGDRPAPSPIPPWRDADRRGPHGALAARPDEEPDRTSVLRVPTFSLLAPLLGWLAAWGAISTATAILERVGVPTGFNLGIAAGGPGDSGFWAGVWALVVSGGAFVIGGYTAARLARANGTRHAVLVWVIAMAATAADAIIESMRTGEHGAVRLVTGVPFWSETGLTSETKAVLVLAIFAAVSLVGAMIGGGLGQAANRIDRTDDAVVVPPSRQSTAA
jgi:hypothetical protein